MRVKYKLELQLCVIDMGYFVVFGRLNEGEGERERGDSYFALI